MMTSNDYPYWTYDELNEINYYEYRMEYITNKYMSSVDKDDIVYPPVEYWESGVEYD